MIITFDNAQAKAAGMGALAARVGTVHARNWGNAVAKKGEKTIQDVIMAGGMNPTKKGGPRVKSGAMYDSVDSETRVAGGVADVFAGIGWNKVPPLHALFQEGGTSRGVTPMLAIPMALMEMADEVDDAGHRTMMNIQGEWNGI